MQAWRTRVWVAPVWPHSRWTVLHGLSPTGVSTFQLPGTAGVRGALPKYTPEPQSSCQAQDVVDDIVEQAVCWRESDPGLPSSAEAQGCPAAVLRGAWGICYVYTKRNTSYFHGYCCCLSLRFILDVDPLGCWDLIFIWASYAALMVKNLLTTRRHKRWVQSPKSGRCSWRSWTCSLHQHSCSQNPQDYSLR